jgi:cyanate lyase
MRKSSRTYVAVGIQIAICLATGCQSVHQSQTPVLEAKPADPLRETAPSGEMQGKPAQREFNRVAWFGHKKAVVYTRWTMADDVVANVIRTGLREDEVAQKLGKPDYSGRNGRGMPAPVYVYKLYHNTDKGMAPYKEPILRAFFEDGRVSSIDVVFYRHPSDDETPPGLPNTVSSFDGRVGEW